MAGLREKSAYPIFFVGTFLMLLPGIIYGHTALITGLQMEWMIGIGFFLFVLCMALGLLERKH